MIRKIFDPQEKEQIAGHILSDLPDWFGLPESTKTYIEESKAMPFWAAFVNDGPAGFISMKATSPDTAEVYVMGVRKASHRQGMGKALFDALEADAVEKGYSFLQVKTVQMGRYEEYDRTNRFYMAMGFKELECFPALWAPCNPCQIYVKYIGR